MIHLPSHSHAATASFINFIGFQSVCFLSGFSITCQGYWQGSLWSPSSCIMWGGSLIEIFIRRQRQQLCSSCLIIKMWESWNEDSSYKNAPVAVWEKLFTCKDRRGKIKRESATTQIASKYKKRKQLIWNTRHLNHVLLLNYRDTDDNKGTACNVFKLPSCDL